MRNNNLLYYRRNRNKKSVIVDFRGTNNNKYKAGYVDKLI